MSLEVRGTKRKRLDKQVHSHRDSKTHSTSYEGHTIARSSVNPTHKPNGSLQSPSTSNSNNGKPVTSPSSRLEALTKARAQLPISSHASSILASLDRTNVLLLSGETGSGKSTQFPQFLLSASWRKHRIAVTQPRRVAAINLARRVADEQGTPVGKSSPAARVGYSVRFDDNVGRGNQIKFLTEGMLLQEMLRDPGLREYDVVVVDEVHERSVNVDLILGFLRELLLGKGPGGKLRKGRPLKVVVMSATADTQALNDFFDEGYREQEAASSSGETGSASQEDGTGTAQMDNGSARPPGAVPSDRTKTSTKVNGTTSRGATSNSAAASSKDGTTSNHVSRCLVEGRQYPVVTTYLPEPAQDFSDAALKSVFQAHCKEPMPGDILVFLTGQETIQSVQRNVEEYARSLTAEYPKLLVLPLYAALPQAAQQRIFEPAPPNTRKIILATNIAETSITVPGVRFVIDCGKEKRKQFRPRLGLDSLLVKSVSQSSAIQRRGRAGREAPGKCWRLYTEKDYEGLDKDNLPEIMRCDLADAVLKMKANGVDDVLSFPLLTRPSRESLARSLVHLYGLGALNDDGSISTIGRKISRFPLSPAFGRVLLAAADDDMACLLPVIDIVACFSSDNSVFLNPETEEAREEAQTARHRLFRRQGDHLTLLATVQAYAAENADRRDWAERHMVSHRAMQGVMDIRKQLRAQCVQQGLFGSSNSTSSSSAATAPAKTAIDDYDASTSPVSEEASANILRCFLRGFGGNVARLMPDGGYRTFAGNQAVAIHPSSVLFGRKVEAILYNEFVFTSRTYARGVSAVQADWVAEVIGRDS